MLAARIVLGARMQDSCGVEGTGGGDSKDQDSPGSSKVKASLPHTG